jgi:hypothetical protein
MSGGHPCKKAIRPRKIFGFHCHIRLGSRAGQSEKSADCYAQFEIIKVYNDQTSGTYLFTIE